jgi:large subunit ribosomal protein L25
MTEELTVDVPLVSEGESEAVETAGGTLLHVIEHVRVRALPDHLPQSIHYSIESLRTFDDQIHVRDLVIPADATLLTDVDEVVAKVLAPRVEEEPVVAEAAEGAETEAAEGEAAEGGESGGDSGGTDES